MLLTPDALERRARRARARIERRPVRHPRPARRPHRRHEPGRDPDHPAVGRAGRGGPPRARRPADAGRDAAAAAGDHLRRPVRRRGADLRLPPARHHDGRPDVRARRSLPLRPGDGRARPAPARRGPPLPRLRAPRLARAEDRVGDRHLLRGVGAERRARQPGRRLQPVARPGPPDAPARAERHLGAVRPRPRRRRALQVRAARQVRSHAVPQGRSLRARVRDAAGDGGADQRRPAIPLARRRLGQGPRGLERQPVGPGVDLRSAPRVVGARRRGRQPLAQLSRARRAARALREGHGLHAHRAAAGAGAPVRRLVGLPGHRLLRADQPARLARRLPLVRRRVPPPRHRRDPRLGARPLPEGRARPRPLRRHRALRARGSADGRAPGLGHADLQLRPPRGRQLPRRERAVLDRAVPPRRPARRRRRLDALPRLLAPGRPMGAEPLRRPREHRSRRLPPPPERDRPRRAPGRDDDRGGVDGVAGGEPPGLRRRARLHLQVEHGLDARHPDLHVEGSGAPPVGAPAPDVLDALRLQRELRPAVQPRRGGARQGLDDRQDVGRLVAEGRQPARPLRLHVRAPGQEAAVHGQRAGRVARMGRRRRAAVGLGRRRAARRRAGAGPRSEPAVSRAGAAAPGRLPADRLQLDRLRRRRAQRHLADPPGRAREGRSARRLQLHAGRARGLSHGRARARAAIASWSTPTPRSTAAATSATPACSTPSRSRRRAWRSRWC